MHSGEKPWNFYFCLQAHFHVRKRYWIEWVPFVWTFAAIIRSYSPCKIVKILISRPFIFQWTDGSWRNTCSFSCHLITPVFTALCSSAAWFGHCPLSNWVATQTLNRKRFDSCYFLWIHLFDVLWRWNNSSSKSFLISCWVSLHVFGRLSILYTPFTYSRLCVFHTYRNYRFLGSPQMRIFGLKCLFC